MPDVQMNRLVDLVEPLRVPPGSRVVLDRDFDPGSKSGLRRDGDGAWLLRAGARLLADRQARLAAQDTYAVLVVIEAPGAAGKDGTIRHLMSAMNPQGVTVHSFRAPSAEELGHDYLWRYACRLPARGAIGIFNRSYYEEVLLVRVDEKLLRRQRLPADGAGDGLWRRRFREINDWERYLADNGIRLVKLLLNVSKEEQRARFLRRTQRPERHWRLGTDDARERRRWDEHQAAYGDMLTHTSTPWAPWHVIPADHRWFARAASAAVLLRCLDGIDPARPGARRTTRRELLAVRAALENEAPDDAATDPFERELTARPVVGPAPAKPREATSDAHAEGTRDTDGDRGRGQLRGAGGDEPARPGSDRSPRDRRRRRDHHAA